MISIPVKIKSNISGRVVNSGTSPRELLNFIDEADLIDELTKCNCEPVGETNFIECNCDEEWTDCEVLIGDEIK